MAAHVPWQLLPGRPCLRMRHQRHRHRALGYQGKIRRHARLQTPRRTRPRQSRLLPTHPRRNHRRSRAELPRPRGRGLEIRPLGTTRNLRPIRRQRHLPARTRRIHAASRRPDVQSPRSRRPRNPDPSRRTHPSRHRAYRPVVQRPRRVQAVLHRRPASFRKPRLLPQPPQPTERSHRRRRTMGLQVALPAGHRRGTHRLRPH